jgi:hypothetical protein
MELTFTATSKLYARSSGPAMGEMINFANCQDCWFFLMIALIIWFGFHFMAERVRPPQPQARRPGTGRCKRPGLNRRREGDEMFLAWFPFLSGKTLLVLQASSLQTEIGLILPAFKG